MSRPTPAQHTSRRYSRSPAEVAKKNRGGKKAAPSVDVPAAEDDRPDQPVFGPILMLFVVMLGKASAVGAEPVAPLTDYPRAALLATTDDVAPATQKSRQIFLDVRPKDKFEAGHVPGAIWIDVAALGKAVTEDRDTQSWTTRLEGYGLNRDSQIIVYDDQRQRDAARTWWILRLWGVPHVRLLNGGWPAYVASEKAVEQGPSPVPPLGNIVALRQEKVFASKDLLLDAHRSGRLGQTGQDKLQVVDTRTNDEFCGTAEGRTRHKGTIPGAKHLEWSDLLEPDTARFKSPEALRSLFAQKDIDLATPSVSFCQGGGRASVMAFGLELMGAPESRNYYASWGEWGNADDVPIVRPEGTSKAP